MKPATAQHAGLLASVTMSRQVKGNKLRKDYSLETDVSDQYMAWLGNHDSRLDTKNRLQFVHWKTKTVLTRLFQTNLRDI